MNSLLALSAHSLYRRRWILVAECVVLCLFQVLAVAGARSVESAGGFGAFSMLLPSFMQQWAGVMMSSFSALSLIGYSHPVVILLLVATAITIATEVVEEAETRFVDLVMARPVARSTPVNRSIVVLVVATSAALASMMLGTAIGMAVLKPEAAAAPSARTVASLAASLGLVVLAWGAIALAIASASTRRATAAGIAGLLAATMFILALLGEFWKAAEPYAVISPFWYLDASAVVGGAGLSLNDALVLTAIAAAGFALAHAAYARRDL